MSKAALDMIMIKKVLTRNNIQYSFHRTAALEMADPGIRVNAVGFTRSGCCYIDINMIEDIITRTNCPRKVREIESGS